MTTDTQEAFNAAIDGINALHIAANGALSGEFRAIAEVASDGQSVSLRLARKNTLDELVSRVAWLARDLVDVLLKVASDDEPYEVMGSDTPARIRKAEIRLELLREMSR